MRVRLLIAFLMLGLCARAADPPTAADPVSRLNVLLHQLATRQVRLQGDVITNARSLVADTRLVWSINPSRAVDAALAMLDVMGLYLDASTDPSALTPEAELRNEAENTLRANFDAAFGRWMVSEVLALPGSAPLDRRLAVVRLLETINVPSAKLPLLSAAREKDPRMRRAAARALVGWNDDVVHSFFMGLLEAPNSGFDRGSAWLAEKHFSGLRFENGSRVLDEYTKRVRNDLVASDWRKASRAVVLQTPIANETAIPALIEALSIWKARGEAGAQSLRIRFEIQRALRARSGRSLGMDPEEWRAWWALMRGDGARAVAPVTQGGQVESTEASFFGIRPASDRVVFVIDRSGSMNFAFGDQATGRGEAARKRWSEARSQLFGFLEAIGPKARFDIVLFHTIPEVWRGKLVAADKENLAALREWLKFQIPNGGTQLRAGVEAALHADANGSVDLALLEADTVIVLCDGETAEGSSWVEPFLEKVLPTTRVVFHGVQIGGQGDETMVRLARGSRGDYVRVDG
ncbi:MAG: hypothetical protein JNL28_05540 [Planctomycetes bacterium]|nr:hypothetical protein [Planctomycetota bacterium]